MTAVIPAKAFSTTAVIVDRELPMVSPNALDGELPDHGICSCLT